jgi:hypothetical protein
VVVMVVVLLMSVRKCRKEKCSCDETNLTMPLMDSIDVVHAEEVGAAEIWSSRQSAAHKVIHQHHDGTRIIDAGISKSLETKRSAT